jgi:hypothetical protein
MNFWIVVEEEHGEIFVHPFNCLQMARDYAKNQCTGFVRIELHVMNVGYQGKEQLEASQ